MSRKSLTQRISLWVPPLVYMGVIFFFSAESNPMPEVRSIIWDKLLHGVEYGGLAALLARAFSGEGFASKSSLVFALIAASAYAASDEWHQAFVPLRESDVVDWAADSIGSVVGALTYAVFRGTLRRGEIGSAAPKR